MMEKITRQECEETAKRISKTLEDILPKKIEFHKEFELEINKRKEGYGGLFGGLKKFCRDKYTKEHEEYQEKFLEINKDIINYLSGILKETKDYSKINSKRLENIKIALEEKNKNHKKHAKNSDDPEIYEVLFQYQEFVESEIKPYFEINSHELIGFGGPLNKRLNNLAKYSSSNHIKPIAEDLIKKMGEVYNINAEREMRGDKKNAFMTLDGALSTTSQCQQYIKRIGENLGLSQEEAFSFSGIKEKHKELSEYKSTSGIVRLA